MMYAISASYGNDSMAMIQWAAEAGLRDVVVVYCDTGWSAPLWWKRIDEGEALCKRLGFPSVRLQSMGMDALVRMKKGFPGNGQQFCTAWLKGLPFLQWIDDVDPEFSCVVMVGKRRDESPDRRDTPEWVESSEYHGGRKLWHPLYMHSDSERNALLRRAGIEILSHRSEECSPCVNANLDDLRRLSLQDAFKVQALEIDVGQPMFRAAKHAGAQGIQQVITWAKYSPGQYKPGQADLFDSGCGSPFGCGL